MTEFERRDPDWLSVDEAVRRVLEAAPPLPGEDVSLDEALGRALDRAMEARATLPPWDNSAMDGYAVRGDDIAGARSDAPAVLDVVGEVRAGDPATPPVGSGEAVRIMTGAPVPDGADSVVRVEHTDAEEDGEGRVRVFEDGDRDRNIRPRGRDMKAGETVLEAGTTLTPGVIAVAAALGHPRLPVRRRPRVGIMSSGDELRPVARFQDVMDGRGIPETNGPALAAAVCHCGGEVVDLGIALDDPEDIRRRLRGAVECDVLVTSGGASMGEADLFKRVLEEEGLSVDFWRVRIRPGSPFSLSHLPRRDREPLPVLGLPGNPASAFVTFEIFARPFVLRMAGHGRVHRRVVEAVAGERFRSPARLTHFHRVVLDEEGGRPVARLTGSQSSGLVRSLARAHGLAVVPEGVEDLEEGEALQVILLDDGPAQSEEPPYRAKLE